MQNICHFHMFIALSFVTSTCCDMCCPQEAIWKSIAPFHILEGRGGTHFFSLAREPTVDESTSPLKLVESSAW